MSLLIQEIVEFVWGLPLVFLLVGGGIYLLFVSRFLPLTGFWHAIQLLRGTYHHKTTKKTLGQITHFEALMTALSATVGLGNISGVAVAISQGGPGAVFWMWVTAFIGMNTKFFECSLSVLYRQRDYEGEIQGGPMYVMETALPKLGKVLAFSFALCGLLGTLCLFQVNQLSEFVHTEFKVRKIVIGAVCASSVAYILFGGLKRLVLVTSRLVPSMCFLYVALAFGVLFFHFEKIPGVFVSIFSQAFNLESLFGGTGAGALILIMVTGVKRAAFSNEAGIGTAPMAHGNAHTAEPISEGLVAMLGPMLDTLVICTLTALVILVSLAPEEYVGNGVQGISLTLLAFQKTFGQYAVYLLGIAILLFSFTTMVGMANYNTKCWNYLFKGRFGLGKNTFITFYALTMLVGSQWALSDIVNLLDIGYGLMAVPNMFVTIYLAKTVKREMDLYFKNYKINSPQKNNLE